MNITEGIPITIPDMDDTFAFTTTTLQGGGVVTVVTTYTFTRVEPSYTVGGTVSGLTGSGGILQLQVNGSDTVDLTEYGTYEFSGFPDATPYDVQIIDEPTTLTCSFDSANNDGDLAGEDATDLNITCTCASTLEGDWTWEAVWGDFRARTNYTLSSGCSGISIFYEGGISPLRATTFVHCSLFTNLFAANTRGVILVFKVIHQPYPNPYINSIHLKDIEI